LPAQPIADRGHSERHMGRFSRSAAQLRGRLGMPGTSRTTPGSVSTRRASLTILADTTPRPPGLPSGSARISVDQSAPFDWLFRLSSRLTDRHPRVGARILDSAAGAYAGNPLLRLGQHLVAQHALRRVRAFDRILVIADLNIGDAILLQSVLDAIRHAFPTAELHYVCASAARSVVANDAYGATVHPVLHGSGVPAAGDAEALHALTASGGYDVVFNFCPFLSTRAIAPGVQVVGFAALAAKLIRAQRDPAVVGHVVWMAHRYMHELLAPFAAACRAQPFAGVTISLAARAVEEADAFLLRGRRAPGAPLVLYNPDASSRFTRMPLELQVQLLRGLLREPVEVILGAGHLARGIEDVLLQALSPAQRGRVRVLPATTPLDTYAAVIDAADLYLTGDTGPMHLAAARKLLRGDGSELRNRTAVLSVFGATPARMYGYASDRAGYLAANQDAPSYSHSIPSPCRNLTCVHKTVKACRRVRCFDAPDAERILADARQALEGRAVTAAAR
jgi:ADP-heptose:LPS heptosyltransferase